MFCCWLFAVKMKKAKIELTKWLLWVAATDICYVWTKIGADQSGNTIILSEWTQTFSLSEQCQQTRECWKNQTCSWVSTPVIPEIDLSTRVIPPEARVGQSRETEHYDILVLAVLLAVWTQGKCLSEAKTKDRSLVVFKSHILQKDVFFRSSVQLHDIQCIPFNNPSYSPDPRQIS